MRWFQ